MAAAFDAFLSIYEHRVADLLRLATGGSGVLPPGAIPPDLVNRLADEAAKAAQHAPHHVRAGPRRLPAGGPHLRRVPAADGTTADYALVADGDDMSYRAAFIDAFRRRGIYPRDLRTLSVESLRWREAENDEPCPSEQLRSGLERLREWALQHVHASTRERPSSSRGTCGARCTAGSRSTSRAAPTSRTPPSWGIDPAAGFEVHSLRVANRVSPDGDLLRQIIIEILQEHEMPLDPKDPAARRPWSRAARPSSPTSSA